MEKGMVVKYQKLGFLQTKGKKTPWKVPAVYSKIDDRLKKQPMGQEDLLQFQPTVYHREYDKMMSGREDICYVTNQEALLGNVGF